jgi:hypothetical protein
MILHSTSITGTNFPNMRYLIVLLLLFLFSCNSSTEFKPPASITVRDTIIVHDTVFTDNPSDNWQQNFDLTHQPDEDSVWFKPVSYYLNNPDCSGLASDFYYGSLRPRDDGTTDELLKLATVNDNRLRPFYRWCLNLTIIIQDGGLAEHTGFPARKYAEKFPEEFFHYMDADSTKARYEDWVSAISYSGFYRKEDYRKPLEISKRFASVMKSNCKGCDEKTLTRIDKFAKECFN